MMNPASRADVLSRPPAPKGRRTERPSRASRSGLLFFLGLFVFLPGCALDGDPVARGDASAASAETPSGLPKDINATFLDEEMDVSSFVERFEGESRAVYAERQPITDSLGLQPGDRVADIGAGTGFFTALFDAAVGPTGATYAVEISPQFLKHLRRRALQENLQSVEVVQGTMTSVELPEASIDVAFICDVYHHFESPAATLASLFQAIEPGGELILIEFERIPGETPDWLLKHVRAGREVFRAEIEAAGFHWQEEIELAGLDDNYIFRFKRPASDQP